MTCPNCQETLTMSARQGVEIDFCPKCRGIWLDRGELDKLLEREAALVTGRAPSDARGRSRRDDDDDEYRRGRKSFWRELFD